MLENPLVISSYGTFSYSPPAPSPPTSTQMAICAAAAARGGAASLKRSGTKALTAQHVGQKEVKSAGCSPFAG